MESGYSVVNALPPGYAPDYTSFLFHHPDHLKLQANDWVNFYLLRKLNQKAMAQVSFHIEGNQALSPVRAPFGSFLFSERLSPLGLYQFIQHCEDELRKRGVKSIKIVDPPLFYRKTGQLLHTILFNLNYQVSLAELSSGILIDHLNFEEKIEMWEKRKLKQSKDKGLQCKLLPLSELETVYHFILKCRNQKGYTLSMTLDELKYTIEPFRSNFFLFGTFLKLEIAAASIAIRVHPSILYNFYSGHLKKFDSVSPVVLLTQGMYKFCAQQNIQQLDLGTSAIDGQPNFSLLDFKLRLGALPSSKLTFEKLLA